MTIQVSELLTFNEIKYRIRATPLTLWLETCRPDLKFKSIGSWCWRNYMGTWMIDKGGLYLTSIEANHEDGTEVTLASLFPGFEIAVFAHWFTGVIETSAPISDKEADAEKKVWHILKGKIISSAPEISTTPI